MVSVKAALEDVLTEAKLHFFSFIAGKLQPFLKKYQTENPMMVYIYRDLKLLSKNLLQLVVKSDILAKAKSGKQLREINLSNEDNLRSLKDIDMGFAAETEIKKLRHQDTGTKTQLKEFHEGCRVFVTSILSKLFERSPLGSDILRLFGVIDLNNISSLPKQSLQNTMKKLLCVLVELKIISISNGDKALEQFSAFLDNECERYKEKFQSFSEKTRLDNFYFSEIGVQKYQELSFVIRLLLTLSHGQSAVERDFSLRKNLEQHNMSPESIIAKRMIKDHLCNNKLAPYEVVIDKSLPLWAMQGGSGCNTMRKRGGRKRILLLKQKQ